MSSIKIDFAQFDLILPEENRLNRLGINVNLSGYVSLTKNLCAKIYWEEVVFFVHKKGDIILIKKHTEEPRYFTIPQSNSIKAKTLAERLLKLSIPLPAFYDISWDDETETWVGVLEKKPSKPTPGKTLKRKMPKLPDLI